MSKHPIKMSIDKETERKICSGDFEHIFNFQTPQEKGVAAKFIRDLTQDVVRKTPLVSTAHYQALKIATFLDISCPFVWTPERNSEENVDVEKDTVLVTFKFDNNKTISKVVSAEEYRDRFSSKEPM